MHEFAKVELVRIVDAARSRAELDVLIGHAEAVLQGLGLHHRVIKLAAGDTGFASQLTFDIEVWLPGQRRLPGDRVGVGLAARSRRGGRASAPRPRTARAGSRARSTARGCPSGARSSPFSSKVNGPTARVALPEALVPYTGFDSLTPA